MYRRINNPLTTNLSVLSCRNAKTRTKKSERYWVVSNVALKLCVELVHLLLLLFGPGDSLIFRRLELRSTRVSVYVFENSQLYFSLLIS